MSEPRISEGWGRITNDLKGVSTVHWTRSSNVVEEDNRKTLQVSVADSSNTTCFRNELENGKYFFNHEVALINGTDLGKVESSTRYRNAFGVTPAVNYALWYNHN